MSTEHPALAEIVFDHGFNGSGHNGQCDCGDTTTGPSEPDWYPYDMGCHSRHVEKVWREACTIRTVEQLDALPRDAVVVDAVGIPRTKRHGNSHMPGGWTHAGNSPLTSRELADGRDMWIAFHPGWEAS